MSGDVEEDRKKNFCFPFGIFFRKRETVAPFEPEEHAECLMCFYSIGANRNYHYKCGHGEFCPKCIHEWSKKSNNCPVCRADAKKKKKKKKKKKHRRRDRYSRRALYYL